jgi:hypothetical protein
MISLRPWLVALIYELTTGASGFSQGIFEFRIYEPTRLYSSDGPVAGTNIWGQMLIGRTVESMSAVGVPVRHNGGLVDGGAVAVDGTPDIFTEVYGQMVAWDGLLWGGSLANVPPDQLGKTDIVTMYVTQFPLPYGPPPFSVYPIVPIPEPAVWKFGLMGAGLLFYFRKKGGSYGGDS